MRYRLSLGLMVCGLLIAAALRLPELTRHPPGPHYDEAANGILAGDIGFRGERPVFIDSYTGKEPLYFYLAGGLMRLLGESVFSLRLTSAFIGILTVAATYWLGWELVHDRRIAVLAACLLAVSFWHLLLSRLGFRAISQPLMQALAVAALFRGLRRDSWLWLIVGGSALGLTGYTYLAARVFPIPLALALLPVLLGRDRRRLRWQQIGLYVLTALVVAAPLAIYFVNHPERFWTRIEQVFPTGEGLAVLGASFLRSLEMFFLLGDPYIRFNIPSRPLLDWFWGGLFLVGWLYCVVRWPRMSADRLRSALLLLVLIPIAMILPTALAIGEIVPSNLRAIGLLPFLLYLPALGLLILLDSIRPMLNRLLRWLWPRLPQSVTNLASRSRLGLTTVLVAGVTVLILGVGSVQTARAYLYGWADRTDLFYESDADLADVSAFLDGAEASGKTLFLSALHYRHPTIAFLSDRYDQVKWLPEGEALVFPASGPALYLYPGNSPLPDWAAGYLPDQIELDGYLDPEGEPSFEAFELANPAEAAQAAIVAIAQPVNANFSNTVTLLGYELASGPSGGMLPLTVIWRVEGRPPAGYTPFVHLEDAWQYRWSQVETFAYPEEQWVPGDVIVQRIDVPLPDGIPPGNYRLRFGFFDPAGGQQLALLDEAGRYAGNAFSMDGAVVTYAPPPEPLPQPPDVLKLHAGPNLILSGYESGQTEVDAGADLRLALWWEALAPLDPMTIRLELFKADNTGRILANTEPVHATYPFASWTPPQFVIDHQRLSVPEDLPAGDYRLGLRLLDGDDETILTADLGPLTVVESDRQFSPPKTQFPLAAIFGSEIRLLGYDRRQLDDGRIALDLVWKAAFKPAADYTVFVHLLDQDGVCCLWQADNQPQQGTSPTSQWLPGEVVVDSYLIDLPPDLPQGQYPLEVGLYQAENGRRLLVEMPGIRPNDALFLRPLTVE